VNALDSYKDKLLYVANMPLIYYLLFLAAFRYSKMGTSKPIFTNPFSAIFLNFSSGIIGIAKLQFSSRPLKNSRPNPAPLIAYLKFFSDLTSTIL